MFITYHSIYLTKAPSLFDVQLWRFTAPETPPSETRNIKWIESISVDATELLRGCRSKSQLKYYIGHVYPLKDLDFWCSFPSDAAKFSNLWLRKKSQHSEKKTSITIQGINTTHWWKSYVESSPGGIGEFPGGMFHIVDGSEIPFPNNLAWRGRNLVNNGR